MFSWDVTELTAEQSQAVLDPESIFLIACPGSGKTRTLTYKIAYELSLLESKRKFIVAITYTNRAADEIKERIESLGVQTDQLWIGTIHSFCLEWIIRPYYIYEPKLSSGFKIIDLHEREKLLEKLCIPYKNERITHFDCDYYVDEGGYYLSCPDKRKHASIHKIMTEYLAALDANKQIDFELILWYSSSLMKNVPAINRNLSLMFPLILVDEYQDTKHIQYSIISGILKQGNGLSRLFMVGDPNQAIFGSLGGYPIDLAKLTLLTGLKITSHELTENFRSSQKIINYFNNFNLYKTNINAAGIHSNYQSSICYNNKVHKEDLVHEISRIIRYSIENNGVKPDEICVVAPQWLHLASMTRQLVVNMPDLSFNGPGMVPFSRDIENFWYKIAKIALTLPSPENFVRRLRWAAEVIKSFEDIGITLPNKNSRQFLKMCNSIKHDEQDGIKFLDLFFTSVLKELDIDLNLFPELHEHFNAFFNSSAARIKKLEDDGIFGIRDIKFFRKVFENKAGITVSTIHGVKGAEFDVVISYALLEGMVPHFNDPEADNAAKKLIYVIASRARKHVYIFSETGRPRGKNDIYYPTNVLNRCVYQYDGI